MLKYTCFSGPKQVFKTLGSPGNIFLVGERKLQENPFSALVPGAASECHIRLTSALADQGLMGWATGDAGGPPAVSASLEHATRADRSLGELRKLTVLLLCSLCPFFTAVLHPEKSLMNFQPRSCRAHFMSCLMSCPIAKIPVLFSYCPGNKHISTSHAGGSSELTSGQLQGNTRSHNSVSGWVSQTVWWVGI